MTPERFAELERIYLAVLNQPPDERAGYLEAACRSDAELRAQVEALLVSGPGVADFLETPLVAPATSALGTGERLGPYEIVEHIGTGGMGEVYKARDTRLERAVAIKVLRPEVSADPERRARFEREARTVASLSHPNICPLFDVGEHEGSMFLVMEHLQGNTLAERLKNGPLTLEQAIGIAREIAEALSAAHREGVVHRDLKPANVMLTKTGAKLLDFGLAKLKRYGEGPAVALHSASRGNPALTAAGTIVGTLQYMAPEQIEGKPVDARTDIWALGAMLHEMIAGKRAFEGASAASLVAAILGRDPTPLSTLQPSTPPALDHLVGQCLSKAPDDRPDTAHDIANLLRWAVAGTAPRAAATRRRRAVLAGGIAVVLAGVATGGATWWWLTSRSSAEAGVNYPSLDVRPADRFPDELGSTALAWTPDGQSLVFVGARGDARQIYVRRLDAKVATPIANTEGAAVAVVSPDGASVAFWSFEQDKSGVKSGAIKKVPLAGGPATTLAAGVPQPPIGLTWSEDGRLFFGAGVPPLGIREVMRDGTVRVVTSPQDMDARDGLPLLLPGGRILLLTARRRWASSGDERIDAVTLADGTRKTVLEDAADARYLPTGHLVFMRRGELLAIPFDPARAEVRGRATPLSSGIAQSQMVRWGAAHSGSESNRPFATGAGQFSISSRGMLAWAERPAGDHPDRRLVTVDRVGHVQPIPCEPRGFKETVRVAPDGRRLAVLIGGPREIALWTYDLERGALQLIHGEDEVWWPIWSRDGRSLLYTRYTRNETSIAVQDATPASQPRTFRAGGGKPASFSPDGHLAIWLNLHIVEVSTREGEPSSERALVPPASEESYPEFSPDGRWLAYASKYSRQWEVYVEPYPGPGPRRQVSVDGGNACVWHPGGNELFFVSIEDAAGRRAMMSVAMKDGVPQGRPRKLFEFDPDELSIGGYSLRTHDVTRDGSRFYATERLTVPAPLPPTTHVKLAQDWLRELQRTVPVR